MSVTITRRDELADRLARQVRAAGFAEDALHECWQRRWRQGGEMTWFKLNSRRLALISKEYATGLKTQQRNLPSCRTPRPSARTPRQEHWDG